MIAPPWLRLAVAAAVLAFAAGAGWRARAVVAERDEAALAARLAAERSAAVAEALAETERRVAAQKEITDAAQARERRARADAGAAVSAAERLRAHAAALAARADACDPAAAGPGSAGRLADVLGQCVERYAAVAAAADRAIGAGLACEQSYEALSTKGAQP